jgi:hypothetical protein
MSCKLCDLLPNQMIEQILKTESSRKAAPLIGVGATTVNKHRKMCMGLNNFKPIPQEYVETEFQSFEWTGNSGTFNTGVLPNTLSGMSHEKVLEMFGHNPDEVEIDKVLRESHKQYWDRDNQEMRWKHSYLFGVKKKVANLMSEEIDVVQLLKNISSTPTVKTSKGSIDSTFVVDWADWQLGKSEGGGTLALIERLNNAFNLTLERISELRATGRKLDELVIIGGGDMIEGCVIFPNQMMHIDGNRREQIRTTVAMILKGISVLAPQFKKVRVVVVPGNHGENRLGGSRTEIGDNDDLLVFEMAELACKNDSRFKHVSFEISENDVSMTTQILGWTYGMTHGDVYGKTGGSGVRNKVFNWFKTMAANRHPVGASDVLVTHHFHHDAQEDWGNTLWVQCPTIDGGSHYFKEFSGHDTKPGMATWVVTKNERYQDKQIIR